VRDVSCAAASSSIHDHEADDRSRCRIGALPKLNLTDEERRIFNLLFKQADTKNDGIVTGEVAVTLFPRTKIPENTLGEVWHRTRCTRSRQS
jgi:hypothetical protein